MVILDRRAGLVKSFRRGERARGVAKEQKEQAEANVWPRSRGNRGRTM
jgi:hypothetical protein